MNILYIDGENFLFKVTSVLNDVGLVKNKHEITHLEISKTLESVLSGLHIDEIRFYCARLHLYKESAALEKKSAKLIDVRRRLKRCLENDGIKFVTCGNVRLQTYEPAQGKRTEKAVFKEKGVDVKLAVDLITDVCDKKVNTVFLASSDSDMVPVIREAKNRKAKTVYIGFATQPNKGLIATCDEAILLRPSEVISMFYPKS